ncbi:MAG TPA: hypothetical protein VES42_22855, partial [Pilimelia sp.]|nr:hypothetical protein [Pilimelia sp.]
TAAPGVPRRSAPADDRSSDRPRLAAPPPDEPPAAPPPPAPSPVTVSYEAEAPANTRTGEARTKRVAAASGGTVVGFVGRRPGNTLRVAVTVPVADTYDVRVEYVSGEARPAQVRVNGGAAVPVRFPMTSADWSRVGSVTLRLRLAAGANTVEFGHPEQYTPDFDRFTVIRSS